MRQEIKSAPKAGYPTLGATLRAVS